MKKLKFKMKIIFFFWKKWIVVFNILFNKEKKIKNYFGKNNNKKW